VAGRDAGRREGKVMQNKEDQAKTQKTRQARQSRFNRVPCRFRYLKQRRCIALYGTTTGHIIRESTSFAPNTFVTSSLITSPGAQSSRMFASRWSSVNHHTAFLAHPYYFESHRPISSIYAKLVEYADHRPNST
jgi:hypothetical protein